MLLSVAALTALVASCAPEVAAKELVAIAETESGGDTLAIGDNTTKRSHSPASKEEAVALATGLLREGHSLDIGLMQVSAANFGWLSLDLADAFDACPSIRAGATVLTQISRYNTGSPTLGFSNGYVRKVLRARYVGADAGLGRARVATAAKVPDPPHDWDVFPDQGEAREATVDTESTEDIPPAQTGEDRGGPDMAANPETKEQPQR